MVKSPGAYVAELLPMILLLEGMDRATVGRLGILHLDGSTQYVANSDPRQHRVYWAVGEWGTFSNEDVYRVARTSAFMQTKGYRVVRVVHGTVEYVRDLEGPLKSLGDVVAHLKKYPVRKGSDVFYAYQGKERGYQRAEADGASCLLTVSVPQTEDQSQLTAYLLDEGWYLTYASLGEAANGEPLIVLTYQR